MANKITGVKEANSTEFPRRIVVVEGQWDLIGYVEDTPTHLVIHAAHVLRRWGTTMGLGQIALQGATSESVADNYGTVRVPLHQVIMLIDVVHDKRLTSSGL